MGAMFETDEPLPPLRTVLNPKDEFQLKAIEDVLAERTRQDGKWGSLHDRTEETEHDWIVYIQEYASGAGRGAKYDFRQRMVIAAALAIAAIEAHDANLAAARVADPEAGANVNVPG